NLPTGVVAAPVESGIPRAIIPPLKPAMEETGIGSSFGSGSGSEGGFDLASAPPQPVPQRFAFPAGAPSAQTGEALESAGAEHGPRQPGDWRSLEWAAKFARANGNAPATLPRPDQIADLKPLGQVSASFIVAVNGEGLWIVDQHVAHERVLFEQHLEARRDGKVESQRMLMPLVIELSPRQIVIFERIAEELAANGFEVEPMGPRSVAI